MNDKDIRWKQRFENFSRSFALLEKYTKEEPGNELEQAGIIQFFEMTFELSWKLMKDYLESEGLIVKSPRESIKTAVQIELIGNGHDWLDGLVMRNTTVHLYDEEEAKKAISKIITTFIPMMKQLSVKLQGEME
ncbi:nucleotidyltransferase substrate binding protein [Sporosarcina limicola]|uniref:Nucleotidyltransferase substrate binding protein (TIGR01987 family) n=1 Tax=Sporosarcina limicola TaxID=34101 RepID=A0A927R4K3_9BACL|nr:nucleotidyltransferase substrate binding protein [Sporosarcina limicola]MBE1552974.1 nucleotidyltransferase substrate binding protein (TIGR01987 family) [Sporosarcina limicola]